MKMNEEKAIAVTKLELKLAECVTNCKKRMLFAPIQAKKDLEKLRKNYILDDNTLAMFISVGMVTEYTNLLNRINRILDGDLS
jgi:hypothetical protein